ncbi:TIM-barrel domain-containing protein [Actinosynnema sp. NPDC059797]
MSKRVLVLLAVLVVAVLVAVLVVVFRDGEEHPGAVVDGDVRFQVLTPTLIRAEHAEDGRFEDRPTFNAVNRGLSTTAFTTEEVDGSLVIRTDRLTLRYRKGSGRFGPDNLQVELEAGDEAVTARPVWAPPGVCDLGQVCEAETMLAQEGAQGLRDADGYTGPGYVADLAAPGSGVEWSQRGVTAAGEHRVHFRYRADRAQELVVAGGDQERRVALEPTGGEWAEASAVLALPAGRTPLSLRCPDGGCDAAVDHVAVTPPGDGYPEHAGAEHAAANLGGWRRSLDYVDQPRSLPVLMYEGLLSRDGWYLLDDSETAIANPDGTTTPRAERDGYQDGYFFGYGHDYRQGLRDLKELTGPPVMLPRQAFGNWYSRYAAHHQDYYRDELLPAFEEAGVPLDVLVVDTDFKSPNKWNGWNWDEELFPDPEGFFRWAEEQGLRVALNIHPSIDANDPEYEQAVRTAGKELEPGECGMSGDMDCRVFDLSDPRQRQAYFDLHREFEELDPDLLWWLDSCCDGSRFRPEGISPDSAFNAEYVRRAEEKGRRGFSWNRSGGGYNGYGGNQVYPAGPWAEHRYTVDTSMDTSSTWELLAFASEYTAARGNIGMPYQSHDIGGHNYAGNEENRLPEDLYARWVQFGAFQPLLRLHSNHGYRLPWDYPGVEGAAVKFLKLRKALLPHTYTVARQAYDTGLPMNRPMYLDHPGYEEAYEHPSQFMYGDDVLVAPVTSPGTEDVPTELWVPPGTWTNYFTGETVTGPTVTTVTSDLDTMPVFLRAGGILPTSADDTSNAREQVGDLVLDVAAGASGSYELYEDAGEGLGYRRGEFTRTTVRYSEDDGSVTVEPRAGAFAGAVAERTWTVRLRGVAEPARLAVNGADAPEWEYDAGTRTLTVTATSPTDRELTLTTR